MEAKVQENREVLLSKVCIGTLISITFTVWLDRGVRIPFFSLSLFNSIIDDPILSSVTNTTHDGWGWACFDALPVDKTTQKHLPELVSTPFDFSKMKRQSACLRLHALQFGIRRVGSMPTRTMWTWLESLTLNNGCACCCMIYIAQFGIGCSVWCSRCHNLNLFFTVKTNRNPSFPIISFFFRPPWELLLTQYKNTHGRTEYS